jgi:hypothetical protein
MERMYGYSLVPTVPFPTVTSNYFRQIQKNFLPKKKFPPPNFSQLPAHSYYFLSTVDMTRRSPSYEMRLAKYSNRGFSVVVPSFDRNRVDPQLFEKRFDQLQGLARLLLLGNKNFLGIFSLFRKIGNS